MVWTLLRLSLQRSLYQPSLNSTHMSSLACCFVWNVRGLNGRARRNVVREFLVQERPTLVCILETKLSVICNALANEILGTTFAYDFLPAMNVSSGILLGWNTDC